MESTFLLDQLRTHATSWERTGDAPLDAAQVASRLHLALALADTVRSEVRRDSKLLKDARGAPRDAHRRRHYAWVAEWYRPVPTLVKWLDQVESSGTFLNDADRLRELATDADLFLQGDVEETIKGLNDVDEGRLTPLQEVRDELRRRSWQHVQG